MQLVAAFGLILAVQVQGEDVFRRARETFAFEGCEGEQSLHLEFAASGANACTTRETVFHQDKSMTCAFWNNGLGRFVASNVEPQCKKVSDMGNSRLVEWDGTFVEGSADHGAGGLTRYAYTVVDGAASALARGGAPALPDHRPVPLAAAVLVPEPASAPALSGPVRVLVLQAAHCLACPSDFLSGLMAAGGDGGGDEEGTGQKKGNNLLLHVFAEDTSGLPQSSEAVRVISYSDVGVSQAEMRTQPAGRDWLSAEDVSGLPTDAAARILLDFFAHFDVVFYRDTGWQRPRDVGRLVNLAWLSGAPRLIRLVTADTVLHSSMSQYFSDGMWYPAHGFLSNSHLHSRRLHMAAQLGARTAADVVHVMPPFLDVWLRARAPKECFDTWPRSRHVVFPANGVPVSSPGAFLRLVALLRRDHAEVFATLRFSMVGQGPIVDEMKAFSRALGLTGRVAFVPATSQEEWIDTLLSADLMVDPSPTDSANAFAFPAMGAFQLPIVAFHSSAASEWLLDEQCILVRETSLQAMAAVVAGLYAPVEHSKEDTKDGQDRQKAFSFSPEVLCRVQDVGTRLFSPHHTTAVVLDSLVAAAAAAAAGDRGEMPFPAPGPLPSAADPITPSSAPIAGDSDGDGDGDGVTRTRLERLIAAAAHPERALSLPFSPTKLFDEWRRGERPSNVSITAMHECTRHLDRSDAEVLKLLRRDKDRRRAEVLARKRAPTPVGGRIMCAVYTLERNAAAVTALVDTWGKRCDGFLAFSDVDDIEINAVATDHPGGEAYTNMWRKSQEIWLRLAIAEEAREGEGAGGGSGGGSAPSSGSGDGFEGDDHAEGQGEGDSVGGTYDWFIVGGDDMFLDLDNLRAYLASPEVAAAGADQRPLYLGRAVREGFHLMYNNGGAGYVLNRAAMHVLTEEIARGDCFREQTANVEDLLVGLCLTRVGVSPLDTADSDRRERFHWHRPGSEFDGAGRLYQQLSVTSRTGVDCCSPQSVSFHYVSPPPLMYCVDTLLSLGQDEM